MCNNERLPIVDLSHPFVPQLLALVRKLEGKPVTPPEAKGLGAASMR
jgi:hypothetical protein